MGFERYVYLSRGAGGTAFLGVRAGGEAAYNAGRQSMLYIKLAPCADICGVLYCRRVRRGHMLESARTLRK